MGFWSGVFITLCWVVSLCMAYKKGYDAGEEFAEQQFDNASGYVNYACGDNNDIYVQHPQPGDIIPLCKELKEDGIITS